MARPRFLPETPEAEGEYRTLRDALTMKELAQRYKVSHESIRRMNLALDLPPKPSNMGKKYPNAEAPKRDAIISLGNQGLEPGHIAARANATLFYVRSVLREEKLA